MRKICTAKIETVDKKRNKKTGKQKGGVLDTFFQATSKQGIAKDGKTYSKIKIDTFLCCQKRGSA